MKKNKKFTQEKMKNSEEKRKTPSRKQQFVCLFFPLS
jgi:hypothetical protein